MMKRSIGLVVFGAVGAIGVGCHSHWSNTPTYYHASVATLDRAGSEPVDVTARTNFGDIDVAPVGTPLPGWATKHWGGAIPDGPFVLAVAQSRVEERPATADVSPRWRDGALSFEARWPGGRIKNKSEGVAYAVRIPAIGGVDVLSNFGDLDITSPEGPVAADSNFGDITVSDAASTITARSDFGDLWVESVGPEGTWADLFTEHGEVGVFGVLGRLDIETQFGDIDGEGLGGVIDALTGHGSIDLRLLPDNPGPVTAISEFGDVQLIAGPAFVGDIEMTTEFGNASFIGRSSDGQRRVVRGDEHVLLGLGEGAASRLKTEHGDVRVRIPGSE